jgi:hypothetical protein
MVGSARLGAVVEKCTAGLSELVVEGDRERSPSACDRATGCRHQTPGCGWRSCPSATPASRPAAGGICNIPAAEAGQRATSSLLLPHFRKHHQTRPPPCNHPAGGRGAERPAIPLTPEILRRPALNSNCAALCIHHVYRAATFEETSLAPRGRAGSLVIFAAYPAHPPVR